MRAIEAASRSRRAEEAISTKRVFENGLIFRQQDSDSTRRP